MRDGKYKPQTAFLRFKQDIESGNPQNWYYYPTVLRTGICSDMGYRDLAAYRVLLKHHYRTGDKWVIYPTYDMTHGVTDRYLKLRQFIVFRLISF